MKSFKVVGRGQNRLFEITGGLQEGYGKSGKLHVMDDVVAAHHGWQIETGRIMGLTISPTTVSYGWPQDAAIHCATEPGWRLSGGVNVLYDAALADDEVWDRLESLAAFVADRLGQTRVYISFAGEDFILQAEGEHTPRGE